MRILVNILIHHNFYVLRRLHSNELVVLNERLFQGLKHLNELWEWKLYLLQQ